MSVSPPQPREAERAPAPLPAHPREAEIQARERDLADQLRRLTRRVCKALESPDPSKRPEAQELLSVLARTAAQGARAEAATIDGQQALQDRCG